MPSLQQAVIDNANVFEVLMDAVRSARSARSKCALRGRGRYRRSKAADPILSDPCLPVDIIATRDHSPHGHQHRAGRTARSAFVAARAGEFAMRVPLSSASSCVVTASRVARLRELIQEGWIRRARAVRKTSPPFGSSAIPARLRPRAGKDDLSDQAWFYA